MCYFWRTENDFPTSHALNRKTFYTMKIKKTLATFSLLCLLPATTCKAQTTLFASDSTQLCYRIPALITTHDGKLMAISDFRYARADVGSGRIDVVARTSKDGGTTWSPHQTIVEGGGTVPFDVAHGDAAVVRDKDTGRLLMMCASGNVYYWNSTTQNPNRVGRYYSDNGRDWWGSEITADIYALTQGAVHKLFFSSGRMCQSRSIKVGRYHRIYSALCTNVGNIVLFSDDFGVSWQPLGGAAARPTLDGDEAKLEELPNGDVLLSSRSQKGVGRIFNIFKYADAKKAEGRWGDAVYLDEKYKAAKCNGELLSVPARRVSDGRKVSLLLLSVPQSDERRNVGIYWKVLDKAEDYASPACFRDGWTAFNVSQQLSAYSTMEPIRGGVAFFYEENEQNGGYDMVFRRLTVKEITGGQYK